MKFMVPDFLFDDIPLDTFCLEVSKFIFISKVLPWLLWKSIIFA